jgi:hypothetical protein
MVYLQTTYELCFGKAYFEHFESCDFCRENTNIDVSIHRFCLPMPFRFRKHKGHELAYDVKIMTSKQRLSARQNMKFVTRSLRSLATKLHILARQADVFGIN